MSPSNEKKCTFDQCPCAGDSSTSTQSFVHMIACKFAPPEIALKCLQFLTHVLNFKRHPTIGGSIPCLIPHTSHLTHHTSNITSRSSDASCIYCGKDFTDGDRTARSRISRSWIIYCFIYSIHLTIGQTQSFLQQAPVACHRRAAI